MRGSRTDDGGRVAEPRPELFRDAVADLGIARDPHEPLARTPARASAAARYDFAPCGHRGEPGMPAALGLARPRPAMPEPLAKRCRRSRSAPGAAADRRGRAAGGRSPSATRPRPRRPSPRGAPRSPGRAPSPPRARPRRVPRLDGGRRPRRRPRRHRSRWPRRRPAAAWRAANSAATRSPIRRSRPRLPRSGGVLTRPTCRGRMTRRQPVFVRRMPSGPAGPSTSPGAASRSASAGPQLELVEACWRPCSCRSRAHASTASAAASSSSSSRARSSGSNLVRTWSMTSRPARRSRSGAG